MEKLKFGKNGNLENGNQEEQKFGHLYKWIFRKCNVEKNANLEKFRLGKMQTWKNINFEICKL